MNRDLNRVSVWCNLWRMKLNGSKTKTMILSRSRAVHPQFTTLTLYGTVLKESADLAVLGVMFDAKMTFGKHLNSFCFQCCSSEAWYHEKVLVGIS